MTDGYLNYSELNKRLSQLLSLFSNLQVSPGHIQRLLFLTHFATSEEGEGKIWVQWPFTMLAPSKRAWGSRSKEREKTMTIKGQGRGYKRLCTIKGTSGEELNWMKNKKIGTWPSTSTIKSRKIEWKLKDQIHMTGKKSKEKFQEQRKHYLGVGKKQNSVKKTCTSETVCAMLLVW